MQLIGIPRGDFLRRLDIQRHEQAFSSSSSSSSIVVVVVGSPNVCLCGAFFKSVFVWVFLGECVCLMISKYIVLDLKM